MSLVAFAAMMARPVSAAGTKSVFVGNIPYDATEDQLRDLFEQVGPVASVRLVYEKDTGKPKGFGFCEFGDVEIARSAVRHLNDAELNGRRLKVDFASASQANIYLSQSADGPTYAPVRPMGAGPPMQMRDMREGIDPIARKIAQLNDDEVLEIVAQLKLLLQRYPDETRNLIQQNGAMLQAVARVVSSAQQKLARPGSPTAGASASAFPGAPPMMPAAMRANIAPQTFGLMGPPPPMKPMIEAQPPIFPTVPAARQQTAPPNPDTLNHIMHLLRNVQGEKKDALVTLLSITSDQIETIADERKREQVLQLQGELAHLLRMSVSRR